jgi:hypothetical protein
VTLCILTLVGLRFVGNTVQYLARSLYVTLVAYNFHFIVDCMATMIAMAQDNSRLIIVFSNSPWSSPFPSVDMANG